MTSPDTRKLKEKLRADNLQARLTARAKTMLRLRDALAQVHDHIEDEGDRVYFGSTNDAETLKDVWHELDDWAWDDIMADGKLEDVFEVSRKAHARADRLLSEKEALEKELAEARKALEPFATAADNDSYSDDEPLTGYWADVLNSGENAVTFGHLRAARRASHAGGGDGN